MDWGIRAAFLSVLFSGKSRFAPGTIGSFVSIFLGLPLLFFSQESLFLSAALIGLIAIKQIDIYEKQVGKHDDKRIVIDELVGMWMAMSFFDIAQMNILAQIIAIGLCFIFFRIFDITKPSFIGKIDREVRGGLGVVGDDALAGVLGGACAKISFILLEFGLTYFELDLSV